MQKQQNPDKLNNTTEILHIKDVNSKQSVSVSRWFEREIITCVSFIVIIDILWQHRPWYRVSQACMKAQAVMVNIFTNINKRNSYLSFQTNKTTTTYDVEIPTLGWAQTHTKNMMELKPVNGISISPFFIFGSPTTI
jgi:DNA-directed RNA polymerase delta subunit